MFKRIIGFVVVAVICVACFGDLFAGIFNDNYVRVDDSEVVEIMEETKVEDNIISTEELTEEDILEMNNAVKFKNGLNR
jgi:hypothetical protein